jgi:hypothetical protein
MSEIAIVEIGIVAVLGAIALCVGTWTHELTHYLLSRAFGGDPYFIYNLWIFPGAVNLDSDTLSLSDRGIRIAGGSTIIYPLLLLFIYIPLIGIPPLDVSGSQIGTYLHYFSFFALFSSSGFSPHDFLALTSPQEFRKFAELDDDEATYKQAMRHIRLSLR